MSKVSKSLLVQNVDEAVCYSMSCHKTFLICMFVFFHTDFCIYSSLWFCHERPSKQLHDNGAGPKPAASQVSGEQQRCWFTSSAVKWK